MTTRRRRLAELLLARLPRRDDDRGSLMLAFLVIVIATGIGTLMLPSLINQNHSTRFDSSRVRTLHAAQTGIDIVLGQFRATTTTDSDGKVWGDDTGLPCYSTAQPLVGYADPENQSHYSVWVEYYLGDPSVTGATAMPVCASGFGPYDPVSGSRTPKYAKIYSTGTDLIGGQQKSNGRTIVTTYVFQTDDVNISGGQFRIYPDSSGNNWCWDAGSAVPLSGTQLVLRACSLTNPPAPQQVFAYRKDLSIQLVSSVGSTYPSGLCVDTNPTTHSGTVNLVLKPCAVADAIGCGSTCSPWNQQWSIDDYANIEGAKTDQSDIDKYCITAPSQTDGAGLRVTACPSGQSTSDTLRTWVPSPTAGAGMAGADNKQLVNFKGFANCLDVTNQDPSSSYLILYTCKQNPNPSKVAWNQKFTPSPALGTGPTTVLLKTTYTNGTVYCLTAPAASGGYVTVTTPCPSSVTSAAGKFKWTVSQVQDNSGNELPYADKYTIVDSVGDCLALGPNNDFFLGVYYKIVATGCDGTTGQKWNANPSLDTSKLQNTHESEVSGS